MQEIGRAGRSGEKAVATMYYNAADLAEKHMSKEWVAIIKSDKCRRQLLLKHYGFDIDRTNPAVDCCDNCTDKINSMMATCSPKPADVVDRNLIVQCKATLTVYFDAEIKAAAGMGVKCPQVNTGLSPHVLKTVCSTPEIFQDISQIQTKFPDLKLSYASNIALLLKASLDVFKKNNKSPSSVSPH